MTISGHCPHSDDAPLLALGVLDEHEAAALRAHALGCEPCRTALATHEALVGQLERSIERTPAPVFDELVLAAAPPSPVRARTSPRRRRLALAGAVTALAAAAVVALVVALGGGSSASPTAIAQVRSELAGSTASGLARLYHPDRADGLVKLRLRDVPRPAAGTYYAVWVLPRGRRTMEAVGSFVPRRSSVDLTLRLPGKGDYQAVDISIQRVGGPSAHSDRSLAGGAFAPA
jgi:hypothetical protein